MDLDNLKVIKRDGRIKQMNLDRVDNAVSLAYIDVLGEEEGINEYEALRDEILGSIVLLISEVSNKSLSTNGIEKVNFTVEEIQDIVMEVLSSYNFEVYKGYKSYREEREVERTSKVALKFKKDIVDKICEENSNANVDENNFGGKELRIVEEIEKIMADKTLPEDIIKLRKKGILKQHDYAKTVLGMHNCLFIDYPKLLREGFCTRQADTKPANSYQAACQLLAVIIQTQSLEQFGGCGLMNFSIYMTEWLKKTIAQQINQLSYILDLNISKQTSLRFNEAKELLSENNFSKLMIVLNKIIKQSHQALITNLVTLQSRSGHQLPFSSINLGLIDEDNPEESAYIIENFLLELEKGIGKKNRTAIFPITCFQVKGGVNRYPTDKYYYLRLLAERVAHKRLYPTIVNCDWSMNKVTNSASEMNIMGCRTHVGYNRNKDNYEKIGRGNNVPVTINLPYLALESKGDINLFFEKLIDVLDASKRSLLIRYKLMCEQTPSVAKFMYNNKTIMDADKCIDTVEEALKNNTLAIGYIGIAECCKALTGYYHCENKESEHLGIKIITLLKEYCDNCSEEYNLNFSVYSAPCEGYSREALEHIRRDFGIIKGISDKEFITNSHHCPVHLGVPVFKKVDIESKYATLATGGNIFHIEVDGVNYNQKAITKAIDYALDSDISYIRISHPIATCMDCGYTIGCLMEDNCMNCDSNNVENLAIVTGYLSSDVSYMNIGKQNEVKTRELNL